MNRIRHLGEHRNILVIPQVQLDKWRDFTAVMHFYLLGKHHAPATLGLDPAHGRDRRGVAITPAVTMRYLVKAVLRRNRANLQRLEQNVITWISGHRALPIQTLITDL